MTKSCKITPVTGAFAATRSKTSSPADRADVTTTKDIESCVAEALRRVATPTEELMLRRRFAIGGGQLSAKACAAQSRRVVARVLRKLRLSAMPQARAERSIRR